MCLRTTRVYITLSGSHPAAEVLSARVGWQWPRVWERVSPVAETPSPLWDSIVRVSGDLRLCVRRPLICNTRSALPAAEMLSPSWDGIVRVSGNPRLFVRHPCVQLVPDRLFARGGYVHHPCGIAWLLIWGRVRAQQQRFGSVVTMSIE